MDPRTLLTANYLDIVFDGRNKRYGSYELRSNYNKRLGKAFALMISGICLLACMSFMSKSNKPDTKPFTHVVEPSVIDIKPVALPPKPKVVPPEPPAAPAHVKTRLFTPPVIADDIPKDDPRMARKEELAHVQVGSTNSEGDTADVALIPVKHPSGPRTGVSDDIRPDVPRRLVEQMPSFPGDMSAYIGAHLRYPEEARSGNIEGRVVVEFVVNEDGAVTNAKVMRSIGGGCDEEALRMVSGMPHWKAGKQNGVAVKVYFSLPIVFRLE